VHANSDFATQHRLKEPHVRKPVLLPLITALTAALLLTACGPSEPIRIGYVGGLTGRVADLGIAGRNGFQLAVEQMNAAGGVQGRQIEVIVKDDVQDPAQAKRVTEELVAAKVVAIIGPMTSAMAEPVLAAATAGGIAVVSPTVTTTALTGKDDLFLRVSSDTSNYADLSARYHFNKNGARRVAAVFDTRNRAYTESWLNDFRKAFLALGGTVTAELPFESGAETDHAALVAKLLSSKPDALLFITNAVDTAHLAQQARQADPGSKLIGVEWASTEELITLGGQAVEGLHLTQYFDRNDRTQEYLGFRRAYEGRFQQPPGFASVAAFDATRAVLEAIGRAKSSTPVKEALLERGPFTGAQQAVRFDRFGDAQRPAFITKIKDGSFVVEIAD
jgi:branched-chain amino acid transport system substrate-binding protein